MFKNLKQNFTEAVRYLKRGPMIEIPKFTSTNADLVHEIASAENYSDKKAEELYCEYKDQLVMDDFKALERFYDDNKIICVNSWSAKFDINMKDLESLESSLKGDASQRAEAINGLQKLSAQLRAELNEVLNTENKKLQKLQKQKTGDISPSPSKNTSKKKPNKMASKP